jgi:aspartyl-tRNA(Asn)/glutamyl-tRNA(Gln) amidotransferase subunit A
MPDEDIFFATVRELNAKIKAREISAVELTRAFSERLEKLGPRYNALALPLRAQAIRKAIKVDEDVKRNRFRGVVQGVPYGAKDLLSVAGEPTTWGARPFAAQVFDYTATALDKLDKSGAILLGKLSMVELAGGGGYRFASASLMGPGINPWDRTRWSGGSSSGSGSAVAAGLAPFALGSETSGSILTPSAYCGVTGLRPTYGLVSRYGAMALAWTMDKIGPMCRSADDCGLVLHEIAGKDWKDPASAGRSFYYAPQYVRPLPQIRVGFAPVDFEEWAQPATRPVFQAALDVIRKLGVRMIETALPDLPYGLVTSTVISAEGSAVFEPIIRDGRVDQLADKKQIAGLKAGLDILSKDYIKAQRIRTLVQQGFRDLFNNKVHVLLTAARFGPAPQLSEPLDRRNPEFPAPKKPGLSSIIGAGNLAGLPALSLPCGFVDGLPLGLQLVGPAFEENTLLAIGLAFQKVTDWHKRRPPVSS